MLALSPTTSRFAAARAYGLSFALRRIWHFRSNCGLRRSLHVGIRSLQRGRARVTANLQGVSAALQLVVLLTCRILLVMIGRSFGELASSVRSADPKI